MSGLRGYSFGTEPRIRGPFPTGLDVKKPPAINDLPEPLCLDISKYSGCSAKHLSRSVIVQTTVSGHVDAGTLSFLKSLTVRSLRPKTSFPSVAFSSYESSPVLDRFIFLSPLK